MTIPIRNIYYLLAYAWRRVQQDDLTAVDSIDGPQAVDLLGLLLARHVERLVRRGIGRAYEESVDDLTTVRGRMLTGDAQFSLGLRLCRARCRFDEMTVETPHNQLIKATLLKLIRQRNLDSTIREELIGLSRWFAEVSDVRVTRRLLVGLPRHRNNRDYHFPTQICKFVWEHLIPTQTSGGETFVDFVRDEQKMAMLWEEFLKAFFRRHAVGWGVCGRKMIWAGDGEDQVAHGLLPQLRTDIEMSRPGRRRIFDAKYTVSPLVTGQYGGAGLKSGHLYQVLAYAHNARIQGAGETEVDAAILYAGAGGGFSHRYVLQGVPLLVKAIDLRQDWQAIEADLLSII